MITFNMVYVAGIGSAVKTAEVSADDKETPEAAFKDAIERGDIPDDARLIRYGEKRVVQDAGH